MAESFFDFRARVEKRRETVAAANPKTDGALTVSELTAQIERAIKTGVPSSVLVRGETSNFKRHQASGHVYFTLKDASACIDCTMFRSDAARLKFDPEDGMELLVSGRVGVYAQRGRYQLYASTLWPIGRGAMEIAFAQLQAKLAAEGLFDPERKRPLPMYPRRIVLMTSRSTAALQDMLKVLRRFSWIKLCLYHVPVQGDGSAELIAGAIAHFNRHCDRIGGADAIILARGGGSLEDLWEFNEECVARAIVASRIPIVTGIGHEVDVSIADLVADYHAHTPTEAAQVVAAAWRTVPELLAMSRGRLLRGLGAIVGEARHRVLAVRRHEFFRRPTDRIDQLRQWLDDRQRSLQLAVERSCAEARLRTSRIELRLGAFNPRHLIDIRRQQTRELSRRLADSSSHRLERTRQRIELMSRHLEAISPRAVLRRGYSITTRKKDGAIIRSPRELKTGDRVETRFADGSVTSLVEDQKQLPLFE